MLHTRQNRGPVTDQAQSTGSGSRAVSKPHAKSPHHIMPSCVRRCRKGSLGQSHSTYLAETYPSKPSPCIRVRSNPEHAALASESLGTEYLKVSRLRN